jgi:anti-anti-sigma factor
MTIRTQEPSAVILELDDEPGDVLVAHLHGPLDLSTAPDLDRAIQERLDGSSTRCLVLDLRDVSFLGCQGITVFVRLARWASTHQGCGPPCLIGLSTTGRRALELVEVIDMFAVHDTIEAALSGWRAHEGARR